MQENFDHNQDDETEEIRVEYKFATEVEKVVEYFRNEFHITYAQAIGVLTMQIMSLNDASLIESNIDRLEEFDEDEDEDEEDDDEFGLFSSKDD